MKSAMLITDDRLEKALMRIAETDSKVAELHANVERAEYRSKAVRDAVFLRSEGSVAERNAIAGTHPEYGAAMENYFTALRDYEAIKNERSKEDIVIQVWRSMSSARTKGMIT